MALNSDNPPRAAVSMVVKADKGSAETGWVIMAIASILLLAWALFQWNHLSEKAQKTTTLQSDLSAQVLSEKQKSILTELSLAHQELLFFYQMDAQLPSIQWLEDEAIAPFVNDVSWHYLGEHQWYRLVNGYLGIAQQPDAVGHVILWYPPNSMDSPEVWFSSQALVTHVAIESLQESHHLQQVGWKRWLLVRSF
ncbi:hypothetical protein CCZ37_02580 [Vibrio qinghaiensis]|uniref:Uncharacterized protein n=1 Tax=Vibrio qinghaiensis TaxID=2025808 RepID=A0A223MVI9_9VIBR|nr:hypothetical protein [Vibrio qinghaiensis]ASU21546.1 hypothetical protein CCZ37_02580 [Vibrio qinghaiensis]